MSDELQQEIAAIVEAEQPKPAEQAPIPETVAEEAEKPSEEIKADKTFTQAELDEIVQKRITKLERKMERQRIESETRVKVLSEQQQQQAPKVVEKPKAENFEDYGQFLEELAEWKADEKIAQRETEKQQAEAEKAHKSEVERQSERRRSLMESGELKYDDFEEVVKNSPLRIAEPAYLAILESDISADLVYHLSKDPVEAERIANLSPYAQAKEIGKIEEKLSAKQPIKKSDAPKPISPVNGAKDYTKRYEDMTIAEIEADAIKRGARWA
jgi:hypothetical protein